MAWRFSGVVADGTRCSGAASLMRRVPWRGLFLAAVFSLALWSVWMASHFRGIGRAEALEYAQLARNLARGEGFVTSAIWPISLSYFPRLRAHPDMLHAPLFPLWQAAFFRGGGISERMIAASSGLAWAAGIGALFLLARYEFGPRTAWLAVVLYGLQVPVLNASVAGLPHMLTALLLTSLVGILAAAAPRIPTASRRAVRVWSVAIGVAAGWVTLADGWLVYGLAPALPVFWWRLVAGGKPPQPPPTHRSVGAGLIPRQGLEASLCVLLVGGGYFAAHLPWLLRNYLLIHEPFFSLQHYYWLAGTRDFPGQSIFRLYPAPEHSVPDYVLAHLRPLLGKAVRWLGNLLGNGLPGLHPWVLFLALAGLLTPLPKRVRRLHRFAVGMFALVLCGLGMTVQRADELLAFAPVMTVLAAGMATRWAARIRRRTDFARRRSAGFKRLGLTLRPYALLLVLGAPVALPFLAECLQPSVAGPLRFTVEMDQLNEALPAQSAVLTSSPALVAWMADVPAVGLFESDAALDRFLGSGIGRIAYLYLTPQADPSRDQEIEARWMRWSEQARLNRGFVPQRTEFLDCRLLINPSAFLPGDKSSPASPARAAGP